MEEVKLLKNSCLSKGPFVKNNTFYKTLISPSTQQQGYRKRIVYQHKSKVTLHGWLGGLIKF